MDEPTSWCHLPVEMMAEIINYLDFESRMKLRATARLEKEVVESMRMAVDSVSVDSSFRGGLRVSVESIHESSGQLEEGFYGSIEKLTSLTTSLIKFGKVKTFQLFADYKSRHFLDNTASFLEKIVEGVELRFPIININYFNDNDFQSMIESCTPEGTEILHLRRPPELGFKRVFRDYATLPIMLGASILVLPDETHKINSQAHVVVEAWLRHDQGVGRRVVFWLGSFDDGDKWMYEEGARTIEPNIVADFKNHFAGRVVEEKEKSVRIRMDDSSKHILMRILEEEDIYGILVTATWQVIPAELAEEQYDKKSGWVRVDY